MDFKADKPIYLQLVDLCRRKIISGEWAEGERVPSVRELGARLAVNPHTVLKAYDELQREALIEPRRGLGFILCDNAREGVRRAMRDVFIAQEVPAFIAKMKELDISPAEIFDVCPAEDESRPDNIR